MNLKEISNFIFDCDGVLWRGSTILPNAIETLNHLKSLRKTVLFVTNNSTCSRSSYLKKFRNLGLQSVTEADIIGSAYVAALYIKKHLKPGKKVYLIGMKGIEDELNNLGIEFKGGESDSQHLNGVEDLKHLKPDPDIGAVVIGLDVYLNYKKLAKAHIYLSDPDVLFVATNLDSTFPCDQVDLPGTGSIVATLAKSLNRSPIILGKPNVDMLNLLISEFHLDSKSTVMIGDRLDSDIAFGKNGNLFTILVLTGVSTTSDVEGSDLKPDMILDSVGNLLSLV